MALTIDPKMFEALLDRRANDTKARLSPSWVGPPTISTEADYLRGERITYMDVRFTLMAIDLSKPPMWSTDAEQRLRLALQAKEPAPKSIRIDRRLMNARAQRARSTKPRKI